MIMTMEEKKLDRLYKLLKIVEAAKDNDTAAALRWAIFTLEGTIS